MLLERAQGRELAKDRRGSLFTWSGHLMAACITLVFCAVYGYKFYTLDGWKYSLFKGTYDLRKDCVVTLAGASSLPGLDTGLKSQSIALAIPHPNTDIIKLLPGTFAHYQAHYRCQPNVTDYLAQSYDGVTYLHIGWIVGDSTVVKVNDRPVLNFHGTDKPSIPLDEPDLRTGRPVIDILVTSEGARQFGMIGNQPMTIAHGKAVNARILGLEVALQQVRSLYQILPLLTLGMVLVLGWLWGVRSRIIITTFYFFVLCAMKSGLLLFADIWPWKLEATVAYLNTPFYVGMGLSILVFSTEILGIFLPIKIHPSAIISGIVLMLFGVILSGSDPVTEQFTILSYYRYGVTLLALPIVYLGYLRLRRSAVPSERRKITVATLIFTLAFAGIHLADAILSVLQVPLLLLNQIDIFMPLFIGGLLFYNLALIEKSYQKERAQRVKMESDLELARDIQDSIAPPPEHTLMGNLKVSCYQIKHAQVAGDWMAVREVGDEELVVVVADATGKGVQAALVVHAVQSLWADELHHESFDIEQWIIRVNRTLVKLGEKRPHSLTLGAVQLRRGAVTFWSAGHVPLFVTIGIGENSQIRALAAKGSILGVVDDLKLVPAHMEFKEEDRISILLGTDGVFFKGSRTRPREIKEFLSDLLSSGAKCLDKCDQNDDRTLVHIFRDAA